MGLLTNLKNIVEIGLGLLFLVGAIFNASYTPRHGVEFYGSFAASAWFRPSQKLVRTLVIPHAKLFTVLLVALQVSIAVMILSIRNVRLCAEVYPGTATQLSHGAGASRFAGLQEP
jgi:hypothetical protein